jgi:hypothetical protein
LIKSEPINAVAIEKITNLSSGKVEFFGNNLKHIFRNDLGHLPDTPANRQLLAETASNPQNYLGKNKFVNKWYAKNLDNGSQSWTQILDGQIQNGGLNQMPRNFDSIIVSE